MASKKTNDIDGATDEQLNDAAVGASPVEESLPATAASISPATNEANPTATSLSGSLAFALSEVKRLESLLDIATEKLDATSARLHKLLERLALKIEI